MAKCEWAEKNGNNGEWEMEANALRLMLLDIND